MSNNMCIFTCSSASFLTLKAELISDVDASPAVFERVP